MDVTTDLRALGRVPELGLVVVPGGLGLAAGGHRWAVATTEPADLLRALEAEFAPRWTWWSASTALGRVAPVHLARCHDLAAVHRLAFGGAREDAGAVWAGAHDRPAPPPPSRRPLAAHGTGLLDLDGAGADDEPVREDGQVSPTWAEGSAFDVDLPLRLERAARWAELALAVAVAQSRVLATLPDGRVTPGGPPLAVQTAFAESAAAVLAVELSRTGLPVDRSTAEAIVSDAVGPRPSSPGDEQRLRALRDAPVREHLGEIDLRNPAQVLSGLRGLGFDVTDTRAWRLERLRDAHPGIAALLSWRKGERLATTYGYRWLDEHVGPDGRLRGEWSSADAAAGRMTAQAGLHNLPAELRPAVAAERGHVLVRADLGQVEPRVLAAVSHDPGFVAATQADDLYAPVAAALAVDRPTAKVAVLAAMYGQTSGAAGEALKRMDRAYPSALGYLRAAEEAGRQGQDVRTYGGRRVRMYEIADGGDAGAAIAARGRFARNAVVQGAAAELFKAWAATVRAGLSGTGGRIVLCLHDELLLHVPEAEARQAAELLTAALDQTAARWSAGSGVRFVADVSIVGRWSEAK
ncbi:DNA polymerase [Kineococcus sp. NBC_00420]|uniref:DNA polymerase n=1 Tax=Kineococcus sp. NBC_00420 TaxID=2903564 RepID=UPI002E244F7F